MADIDKLANSTASVVSTRLTVLALPILLAVLGWFASTKLDDIKEAQKETKDAQGKFWQTLGAMNNNIADIKTSQATTSANFESHRREDDSFELTVKAAIQDHENRIRLIAQPPTRP